MYKIPVVAKFRYFGIVEHTNDLLRKNEIICSKLLYQLLYSLCWNTALSLCCTYNRVCISRLFHLVITLGFQVLIMRDMEKLTGSVRMTIIYVGAGIAGNLASCIFVPYHVEVRTESFFINRYQRYIFCSLWNFKNIYWTNTYQSWP